MKFNEILNYKRLYSVDSLYSIDSFTMNSRYLEFETFEAFLKLLERYPNMNKNHRIVVPVATVDDLNILGQLKVSLFKAIHIHLKAFNLEIRKKLSNFTTGGYIKIVVDAEDMKTLQLEMKEKPYEPFERFLSNVQCIFRNKIDINNYMQMPYAYQDPFYILPYFNLCEMSFDYYSLNNLTLKDMTSFLYLYNFVDFNTFDAKASVNGLAKRLTPYLILDGNFKDIIFNTEGFHLKDDDEVFIKYDDLDAKKIDLNTDRVPFDVNYGNEYPINTFLINPGLNKKCTGSYFTPAILYEIMTKMCPNHRGSTARQQNNGGRR